MKILIASLIFVFSISAATAGGLFFFRVGSADGSGGPAATGKILLVDGTSFILQTDGASKICLAGGC